jgi:hypothetical protein
MNTGNKFLKGEEFFNCSMSKPLWMPIWSTKKIYQESPELNNFLVLIF